MKIINVKNLPLIYGKWLLRSSNDLNLNKSITYITINDNSMKFKTFKQDGIIGIKNSRTALISNITKIDKDMYFANINYTIKNKYSYSFIGIKIPEIKSESFPYNKEFNCSITLSDKTIFIKDNNSQLYYLFDLYIGLINYPNIDTSVNTFIFTQIFGIFINIIINNIFDLIKNIIY